MLVVGSSWISFFRLRKVHLFLVCWEIMVLCLVFVLNNGCWVCRNTFPVFNEIIMWLFFFKLIWWILLFFGVFFPNGKPTICRTFSDLFLSHSVLVICVFLFFSWSVLLYIGELYWSQKRTTKKLLISLINFGFCFLFDFCPEILMLCCFLEVYFVLSIVFLRWKLKWFLWGLSFLIGV